MIIKINNTEAGVLTKIGNNYMLIGNKGYSVTELYKEVYKKLKQSFVVSGTIGALDNIQVGYRNNQTKKYEVLKFKDSMELVSLNGNVGLKSDKSVFPHIHASLSDDKANMIGGHLVDANISITLECLITPTHAKIQRAYNAETGLDLIKKVSSTFGLRSFFTGSIGMIVILFWISVVTNLLNQGQ